MTLLLVLIVSSAVVGVAAPAFGRRPQASILGLAALTTVAYFLFAARFM